METKFYEFAQNNTGGSFVTNDKLCHRIFIEATTESEAVQKAEDLGCYWMLETYGQELEHVRGRA